MDNNSHLVKIEVQCNNEKCDAPAREWNWDEKSNLPKCLLCGHSTFTWHDPSRHAFKNSMFKEDGTMRTSKELRTGIDEEKVEFCPHGFVIGYDEGSCLDCYPRKEEEE